MAGDRLSALSDAWASWKTAPGVALLAVVAFAVGIGSATAIFVAPEPDFNHLKPTYEAMIKSVQFR